MSSIWGRNFKISVFGESHSKSIGVTIDGIVAGITLDLAQLRRQLDRRSAATHGDFATPRHEPDTCQVLSGLKDGVTTGTPLTIVIENTNVRSQDYNDMQKIIRPGSSDFTAMSKWGDSADLRGSGHLSGRLTAPIVVAGTIARQILEELGIIVVSHIQSAAGVKDRAFAFDLTDMDVERLYNNNFPLLDESVKPRMISAISAAAEEGDSVGGVVECAVLNLPAGIGSPMFNSIESDIGAMMFSIPAVKGVEFGTGFDISNMRGSKANDAFIIEGGQIRTKTNHNGGVLGGITNGMPVIFRVAFKPTPTISAPQQTVDISTFEEVTHSFSGRHDVFFVPRAVPVVEAAACIALYDLWLER